MTDFIYYPRFLQHRLDLKQPPLLDESGVYAGGQKLMPPPYVFNDHIAIAVDVAFATERPLLVDGPPGSGKSTLAPVVAELLGWRYLSYTFNSRTRLEDLTGDIDQLRRLNDAQLGKKDKLPPLWCYLEPGVLWWFFDPRGAALRGRREKEVARLRSKNADDYVEPRHPDNVLRSQLRDTVLLLDEIDKADPDLPNDLLDPLDRRGFQVPQGPRVDPQAGARHFVIITTNRERELPPAVIRRCVTLHLDEPNEERLLSIASQHFPRHSGAEKALHSKIAVKLMEQRTAAKALDRRMPSTSEYLDAIEACVALNINPESERWQQIANATLIKRAVADEG